MSEHLTLSEAEPLVEVSEFLTSDPIDQVKDYQVISCADASKLSKVVRELIDAGWQPFGGVSIGSGLYAQAMVRFNDSTI
jgi:hypothetical protein